MFRLVRAIPYWLQGPLVVLAQALAVAAIILRVDYAPEPLLAPWAELRIVLTDAVLFPVAMFGPYLWLYEWLMAWIAPITPSRA